MRETVTVPGAAVPFSAPRVPPRRHVVPAIPSWLRTLMQIGEAMAPLGLALGVARSSVLAGTAVATAAFVFTLHLKRRRTAMLLLLLVFFIADSRDPTLAHAKEFRFPIIIVSALYGLAVMSRGRIRREVVYFLPFFLTSAIGSFMGDSGPAGGLLKSMSYLVMVASTFHFIAPQIEATPRATASSMYRLYVLLLIVGIVLIPVVPALVFFGNEVRYRGLLGNPNGLGLFVVLSLPIQFAVTDAMPSRHRVLKVVALSCSAIALALSGSRTAMVAFAIFIVARQLIRARPFGKLMIMWAMVVTVMFATQVVDLEEIASSPTIAKVVRVQTLANGAGRFNAWAYASDFIWTAPIFGRGFTFDELLFDDEHRAGIFTERGGHQGGIHNGYLGLLLDTGFLGLFCYLAFIAAVVRETGQTRVLIPTLLLAAFTSVLEGWAVSSLNAFTIMFLLDIVIVSRLRSATMPLHAGRPLAHGPVGVASLRISGT